MLNPAALIKSQGLKNKAFNSNAIRILPCTYISYNYNEYANHMSDNNVHTSFVLSTLL